MKNFAKSVSALVLALVVGAAALCPAAFAAASLPDLPRDQCVVDDANVLSDSTTQTIIDLNNQLQSSCNGAQIGVLTVDYTAIIPLRIMQCRPSTPGASVMLRIITAC